MPKTVGAICAFMIGVRIALVFVLIGLTAGGCYESHQRPEDGGPRADVVVDAGVDAPQDARPDARPDAQPDASVDSSVCDAGPIEPGVELSVDMVFVIDSSGSMSEEQAALAREFPRMVRILATGDVDENGRPEFEPVTDLRVAVITTELATGETDIPGCTPSTLDGDDGVLRTHGYFWRDECTRHYPPFLEFHAGSGGADAFIADFSCVAQVGTGGCGYEQPLEAALKALTPSTSDITFLHDQGRRDRENAGFVRDDAILAVIVITDEDDCSIADPELYDRESERYPWEPASSNLRCFLYPEALMPTERYIDGFQRFKESDPDRFFFAAITGVPSELVTDPSAIDFDGLRADPRMRLRVDVDNPERLSPACDVIGTGYAEPARRILDVVEGLGESATVRSICESTFSEAIGGITTQLGRVIRRSRCR